MVGLRDHHPRAARRARAAGRRRGLRDRPGAAARRRRRAAVAPGDPLRRRHPGHRRDRGADRRARRRRDPAPRRDAAVEPGRRAEVAVVATARARGLRRDPPLPHGELVPRAPADRRVRPRPPLGEPVRPDVRPRRRRLGPRLVRGRRPGSRTAAPRVADRGGGHRHRRGRRRDRAARGHAGHRRDRRRVGGSGQRRGARRRRHDGHVRHDDVPGAGHPGPGAPPEPVVDPGRDPRLVHDRRGDGHLRRRHRVAA